MTTVFMLSHTHEFDDGHEDVKIIGMYSSKTKAEDALAKVQDQPGFRSYPAGFSIDEWSVDSNVIGWLDGFVTAHPDGTFSE
jgi:hypothetical protein